MLTKEQENLIREQAVEAYPNEAVWVLTERGLKQVENAHETPESHFRISKRETVIAHSEGLLAVIHSHPDRDPVPSEADMASQVATGVPWGVLSCDSEAASGINWWGGERPPLLGRPFMHGITDCYALIKDYYLQERQVLLPEYPRDWRWWEAGQDLFVEGFAKAGFRKITAEEARPGDVWLAKIRSRVVNHGGIVLDSGLMLHQLGSPSSPIDHSRLSAREPIGRYIGFITHWLRYEG